MRLNVSIVGLSLVIGVLGFSPEVWRTSAQRTVAGIVQQVEKAQNDDYSPDVSFNEFAATPTVAQPAVLSSGSTTNRIGVFPAGGPPGGSGFGGRGRERTPDGGS